MSWNDEPSFEQVQSALRERGRLKTQIEMLDAQLKIEQAKVAQKKPRDTSAKVIGIDPESSDVLISIQYELAQAKGNLSQIEAEVEFNKMWIEMYKAKAYQSRF